MPRPKKSERLLRKAEAAIMAAIEVYNKPNFLYREETFTILALNAWELLLKAKLVDECRGDIRCLYVYHHPKKKDGSPSKRWELGKNRAGNVQTIGLGGALTKLQETHNFPVGEAVRRNLFALGEVRDNAIHYFNASPELAKQILEIGTASVMNFVELAKRWFNRDFSSYNLYLMPIGFVSGPTIGKAILLSPDEQNLVNYLTRVVQMPDDGGSRDLHVSLEIDISFRRSQAAHAPQFGLTDAPGAPRIQMSEEDIRKQYPWDYAELIDQLTKRYSDFKRNSAFFCIRRPLMQDPKYVHTRYLEPDNSYSSKKDFYSSAILNEFDKHYARVTSTLSRKRLEPQALLV
jgi:hypothetical protein